MCGLCGALGGEDHWTSSLTDPEAARHERHRARAHRIRLVNRVLGVKRLGLEDFQGASYVLSTATGKRELVQDLGGVWRQAQAMTGHAFDPLDPELLAALGSGGQ